MNVSSIILGCKACNTLYLIYSVGHETKPPALRCACGLKIITPPAGLVVPK